MKIRGLKGGIVREMRAGIISHLVAFERLAVGKGVGALVRKWLPMYLQAIVAQW